MKRDGRGATWLAEAGTARDRMVDMDRRLRPVRHRTFAVLAVAVIAAAPWVGWWALGALAVAAGVFRFAETRIDDASNPEYWMFGAWTAAEVVIAASLLLVDGRPVTMLGVLAIPVVTLSARFDRRGVWAGVGVAVILMVVVAALTGAGEVRQEPTLLIEPLAVVAAVAMLSAALAGSDREHRDKAVIDPLTRLPNRALLASHVQELQERSRVTREAVGMIVIDVDGFKRVNDMHGHAAGDAVLVDMAEAMQGCLRAFDRLYRIGGDEFLLLIPGADVAATEGMASRVQMAVSHLRLDGNLGVTLSCGVSASANGEPFDFERVFEVADNALYNAKPGRVGAGESGNWTQLDKNR